MMLIPKNQCKTKMLRTLLKSDGLPRRYLFQRSIKSRDLSKKSELKLGNLLLKGQETETEQLDCQYPILGTFGVSTTNKVHHFSITHDNLMRFIGIGFLPKTITSQICHYLSHLSREGDVEDRSSYAQNAFYIFEYLLKNRSGITDEALRDIVTDVAKTSESNCKIVCDRLSGDLSDIVGKFTKASFSRILCACYKYNLWDYANSFVEKNHESKLVSYFLFDTLVEGLKSSAEIYENLDHGDTFKKKLRLYIFEHLMKISELCFKERMQFITKYSTDIAPILTKLDIEVAINSKIKMSGRCINCHSSLPLFDSESIAQLNKSIKSILLAKADNHNTYINTAQSDIKKFDHFLTDLYHHDKRPIDLVIDGLNVASRTSASVKVVSRDVQDNQIFHKRVGNPDMQSRTLINVIIKSNIIENYKKVLVIGRKHMKYWPNLLEFLAKHKIHFFLLDGATKDDLYQLYAATINPKTLLMSCDLFRDHASQIDDESKNLMLRWLDTRQMWVQSANLKAIVPTPYQKVPSADRSKGHLHIPVIDSNKLAFIGSNEPPPHANQKMLTWLCCSLNKSDLRDK